MVDLLIRGGTVVTMNADREVVEDAAVAVEDGRIVDMGPADGPAGDHMADRSIDASNHLVFPGFISAHAHVADVLLRGVGTDRELYDWLFNVKLPGVAAMDARDNEIAAAVYCAEAIQSGITTVVENGVGSGNGFPLDTIEDKLAVYDRAGLRNVFGHAFRDQSSGTEEFEAYVADVLRREPEVIRPETELRPAEEALDEVESLIKQYHDPAGRQHIWPAPSHAWAVSPEGLQGAYELAERHDVMTTTHAAETAHGERGHSAIEHLDDVGYLGERTLLGHCVQVDERDIRSLAATDTKVAHNPLTNLALGSGIAPVPSMLAAGVTVGLGTDNTSASDTVDMINDMRFAALVQKGHRRDAGTMTAETALEMATIDAARAIRLGDELGSIETGKRADLVLVDLDRPGLVPNPDPASTLVYRARADDVDMVVCDGVPIMEGRTVTAIEDAYPDLRDEAMASFERVVEAAGLSSLCDRPWTSVARA